MKDEGPKVFKLLKTNCALDFLKINTPSASTSESIIVKGSNRLKFLKFWPTRVKQPIGYYFYYFVYFPCISDSFGIIL